MWLKVFGLKQHCGQHIAEHPLGSFPRQLTKFVKHNFHGCQPNNNGCSPNNNGCSRNNNGRSRRLPGSGGIASNCDSVATKTLVELTTVCLHGARRRSLSWRLRPAKIGCHGSKHQCMAQRRRRWRDAPYCRCMCLSDRQRRKCSLVEDGAEQKAGDITDEEEVGFDTRGCFLAG